MTEERIEAIQTRWSLIRNAHLSGKPETAEEARRLLVMRYAPAIRRYLGGILRNDEDADEVAQDVMLRLMRGDFAGADPGRGRFRDLLKTALRNMVRTSWQKSGRRKSADVELDLIAKDDATHDAEWTSQWRKTVLDNTWNRMLAEEEGRPGVQYQALKLKTEFPDDSSEALAEKLSRKTGTEIRADNGRQILRRARSRFAAHLIDEVRAGLDAESEERLQEELAALGLLELIRGFLET
ncbi:MAG: sigma-70 family RNA polymerase sigma factor [Planctomyces sp.]|nr:sigma-70 family RNA polymerase sigma factor [Planctomyces sp.]